MLRTRVITALWLAPLAFLLVFGLPFDGFVVALGAVLLVGTWEFRKLAALTESPLGWMLVLIQVAVFATLFQFLNQASEDPQNLLTLLVLAWLLLLLRLRSYRPGEPPDRTFRILGFVSALIAITGAWLSLILLRALEQGSWWILALLLIIWSADIGAYFTGRAIGKRKLAANLSPGKTIEGLVGGLLSAAVVGWLAIKQFPIQAEGHAAWMCLAILTALISVGGDLFISLHKRTSGCKDSGRIFPGHGGVLDRLDSLLAGAPLFTLGVYFLNGTS